jgi:hypothetical protein
LEDTNVKALLLLSALLLACSSPQPVPDPPPRPTPVDVFGGAVVDCSQASHGAPIDDVRACLDSATTSECLAALFPARTIDTIACAVRALSMSLHVELARTGGSAQAKAEASAADWWIRDHKIGYR